MCVYPYVCARPHAQRMLGGQIVFNLSGLIFLVLTLKLKMNKKTNYTVS